MSLRGEEVALREGDRQAEDQLLLALADGSYLLSTPEGTVAECGSGAHELLGVPADEATGNDAADLIAGGSGDERDRIARVLRAGGSAGTGEAPGARRPELRLTVVPVPLALGWDFTSLLGELGTRDPATWTTAGLRRRHERALAAIDAVCSGAEREAEGRLAGILVVLGDARAPALTREEVHERVLARRAAAEALDGTPDPGPGGDSADGPRALDLRDLVERARVLRERLDEAERKAGEADAGRQELLAELDATRGAHDEEARRRAEAETTASTAGEEADNLRRELQAVSAAAPRQADELRAELDAARTELENARGERDGARSELAGAYAALEQARAERDGLRDELDGARAERDGLRDELDGARAELAVAHAALEQARAESEALGAELEDARADADAARAEGDAMRARASAEARSARAAAEAIRAEFALDAPAAPPNGSVPALPEPSAPGQAGALIGPSGVFVALDEAFCGMLGYREDELRSARWPSLIDRENADEHREIARRLRAGEIAEARIETCYMHSKGLLVPIAGTVSAVRDPDVAPGHLLFRVDTGRH